MHRRPEALAPIEAVTVGETEDDHELVTRIVAAYGRATTGYLSDTSSMWAGFFDHHHQDIHGALIAGDVDRVAATLRDPAASNLFYGFDGLGLSSAGAENPYRPYSSLFILDHLVSFGEASGALDLDYPEGYLYVSARRYTADETVDRIEKKLKTRLVFPNPFPNECGVKSRRGVISHRAVDALYQGWRAAGLLGNSLDSQRLLEIGGGLGRTAFYARMFGVVDYTIVDLPFTAVSSAYFLGRALGPDAIALFGEDVPDARERIKIVPPEAFLSSADRYSLVLNVDSLPEVGRDTAERYMKEIAARALMFLSINHEANEFTVRELLQEKDNAVSYDRFPYWMRRGYTEELVRFSG
jgi:hypothetical protein